MEIANSIGVNPKDMLGVGDGLSDWQFIEPCSYGGTMGNASEELKKLVSLKGRDFSVIGGNVDENGILEIFNYFKL